MATSFSISNDSKFRKPFPKPRMLKDHLLDDMSSCSSNGFRSYPRRQCCTTVRFLLEIDINKNKQSNRKKLLRSRSKEASSATLSAIHRASVSVINAVKRLPFGTVTSPTKPKKVIMPRSFSRRFLRKSFWKKTNRKVIQRRRSFHELVEMKSRPSDFSPSTITTITATDSNSLTSNTESKTNSWSDSDFTGSDYLQCSSGNSAANDVVATNINLSEKMVSERIGVTAGDGSTDSTSTKSSEKEWLNEEKEQFSPISVLDFPFDDDEEVSSPFQHGIVAMQGTKQKLMHKTRRLESLAQLEPVDLEKRISLSEYDHYSVESPLFQHSSMSIEQKLEEDDGITEHKAEELLKKIKATNPSVSLKFNPDNLLLDFFIERNVFNSEVSEAAMDWMNGQPRELLVEWELQKSRQAYIKGMEKGSEWKTLDEEKEEVALVLEAAVFTSLITELLLDLFSS